jgi:hypothetical protein
MDEARRVEGAYPALICCQASVQMEERIVPSYHNFRLAPTSTHATLCIEDAAPIPVNRLLHGIDTANNV